METKKQGFFCYENGMVIILTLVFGFVMFDRFALTNLAPFILPELKLTNSQFGFIMSAFAFAWAIMALSAALTSDLRRQKKKFLAVFVFLFSIASLSTGFAMGFISLILIRILMGLFEGPILPLNQSFMLVQSTTSRRGFNMGVMTTSGVGLISSMLGPIVVVALTNAIGWRATFFLTIIPGLILVFLILKFLKEPDMDAFAATATAEQREKVKFTDVLKNRNVIVMCIYSIFIIGTYVTMLTFSPLFLTNVKGLDPVSMSYVMSALGLGAILWGMLVPALSDRFGRKPIIIIFTLVSLFAPLGFLFTPATSPFLMAVWCFIGWSLAGIFPVFEAAVPTESVNPKFASSAVATVQLCGELIGAVGFVAIAGILADAYGLNAVMWLCHRLMIVAFFVAFGLYETAPSFWKKERRKRVQPLNKRINRSD
jgi:predicted MFS family arabinose efflux permease